MSNKKRKLKVYQMNECDWWADYSKEEARKNYIKYIGEEDVIDDMIEESEKRMITLKYKDEDMKTAITFEQQLVRCPIVGLFASTEF